MNVTISDLLIEQVIAATPAQTVGQVRHTMRERGVNCMPIVDSQQQPVGIVTATDLLQDFPVDKPISEIMTEKVYTVTRYSDVSLAARIMRNHSIHHVIVTEEKKVVGIISSYDLLKLVEEHRFVMKNPPTTSKKSGGRRRKDEVLGQNE